MYYLREKRWMNWAATIYTVLATAMAFTFLAFRPDGGYLTIKLTWWAWTIFLLFVLIHGILIVLSTFKIVKILTLLMLVPQLFMAQKMPLIIMSIGIYIAAFFLSNSKVARVGVILIYAIVLLGVILVAGGDMSYYESWELKQQFFSPNYQFVAEVYDYSGGEKNGMSSVEVRKVSQQDFGIYEVITIGSYLISPKKIIIEKVFWEDARTLVVNGERYFINEQGKPAFR